MSNKCPGVRRRDDPGSGREAEAEVEVESAGVRVCACVCDERIRRARADRSIPRRWTLRIAPRPRLFKLSPS
ncbi:hypothetical protein J6590_054562 [Homalodisca vitripennis]|nr:hypothetical protein J6590_054562 [Homalodisca vitripennis]